MTTTQFIFAWLAAWVVGTGLYFFWQCRFNSFVSRGDLLAGPLAAWLPSLVLTAAALVVMPPIWAWEKTRGERQPKPQKPPSRFTIWMSSKAFSCPKR